MDVQCDAGVQTDVAWFAVLLFYGAGFSIMLPSRYW